MIMSRLADYFVVVGFDHEKERNGASSGKVLQRFPEKDWEDTPFIDGIELFCQPLGWSLSLARQQPSFFVSVLTDIDANRHYCACLSFNEPVAITPSQRSDEEDDEEGGPLEVAVGSPPLHQHHSIMYAPKCLVLVSRLQYFEAFKNCLGILYTVYIDTLPVQMETLVGNILGCVQVPPPGGPQVRYSIGAGDRQALQPPLSPALPVTGQTVYQLFIQLGIHSAVTLFCAAMTEHKILFHSRSYSRLTNACHALTALMFPFKYSHVYIPLLPASLVEVLSTPTPFIMGIHSNLRDDITDLLDVVVVDLDGGALYIPESLSIPLPPSPIYSQLTSNLCLVLRPDLEIADDAFPNSIPSPSSPTILDKEIRAIFLRMFAQLLHGYRSCLTLTRINPTPHITFHKSAFLGRRGLTDNDFMVKLLDCMFFNSFVAERGPPYRTFDIFDELYASMGDGGRVDSRTPEIVRDLANQLHLNENPNPQPYVQKLPRPTEGAFTRIHQPAFPTLDAKVVHNIIQDGLVKNNFKMRLQGLKPQQPRMVPMGPCLPSLEESAGCRANVTNSARRLEVLRSCISHIFDNRIQDARKMCPAVVRALKSSPACRLALAKELSARVTGNKAVLEHQQFDLVVRLLNCALQEDSALDEHGVAAAILPLAMAFCRKLCTGVIQFAYTCLQDHPVWSNQQFWESAFYQDVQRDIQALYQQTSPSRESVGRAKSLIKPTVLEIAAEQMRVWPSLSPERQGELTNNEESTVFSQAIHYANRMVALRVPLDCGRGGSTGAADADSAATSLAEDTDSIGAESGFEEDSVELGASVGRFVARFVDKVCTESGVTEEHIKALHQMIPGVVAMQLETLEAVHRESKRLPPILKPKITMPVLLPGEQLLLQTGLRAYLAPDGRDDAMSLLPAEGALFLTNYRVIFKGSPCDPFAYEQTVVRSFPVTTLTREKRVNVQFLSHVDQLLQEGLQLRSSTFQLLKVAFDEEVSGEEVETLRKLLHRAHAPPSIFHLFTFSAGHLAAAAVSLPSHGAPHKDAKNSTLKGIAKKTFLKTAMKAGFRPKPSSRKHKYIVQGDSKTLPVGGRALSPTAEDPSSTLNGGREDSSSPQQHLDHKTLEKLLERSYCRDYLRLKLAATSPNGSKFRLSSVNSNYSLCRSYPALVVVPQSITDDSLRKLAKCYRHNRFPCITWRHPRTHALLLRAASFHVKGVMGMFKGHQTTSGHHGGHTGMSSETSAQLEQERLVAAVASTTIRPSGSLHDSTLSITSLVLGPAGGTALDNFPTLTPDLVRRTSPFQRAVNTLRASGGKGPLSRWSSALTRDAADVVHTLPRVALYVFGEKTQVKNIKSDNFPNCDFIPVDFYEVRSVKTSFKKLLRACVPSNSVADEEQSFFRALENCEWFSQLQSILQLSGAVVDLLDVQGSSVMVCLEDGWDFATQVISVAQLCLDPYYRTFEGFRILIEKEWLAFGHRFTHRANHLANLAGGFAPIFLQFLDVVHQIHHQFPLSFEFNQYFLRFVAYHYVSCRFRTFLLDSECERAEAGWPLDDGWHPRHRCADPSLGTEDSNDSSPLGTSFWEYVDRLWARSPIFYNVWYINDMEDAAGQVLRPYSQPCHLRVWEYYVGEELAHGPSYDLEVVAGERQREAEQEAADGKATQLRRGVRADFDCLPDVQPHVFAQKLEQIENLQVELGHLPQKWQTLWDKCELPCPLSRQASLTTQQVRSHGRSLHKRSTLEILVRGKMVGGDTASSSQVYSQPHHFEKYNFSSLSYCDYCTNLLWNPVRTGLKCTECGYNCHDKCMEQVPRNCSQQARTRAGGGTADISTAGSLSAVDTTSVSSSGPSLPNSSYYDQFSANVAENRTHEGYLFKRGALLKGWKQRWFVLDSIKHQLRYYDAMEDSHCKGFIDLAEVVSVTPVATAGGLGGTSSGSKSSSFDLKTIRRTYNFMAADGSAAQEWIEKLQACLQ